jgi:hypothetical protein
LVFLNLKEDQNGKKISVFKTNGISSISLNIIQFLIHLPTNQSYNRGPGLLKAV